MNLNIPVSGQSGAVQTLETNEHPVVIIGANGSGKSKIGYLIEQLNQLDRKIVRIPAHRALKLPESATLLSLQQADDALVYGDYNNKNLYYGKYRQESPTVYLQDDFGHLLSRLFADLTERNSNYIEANKNDNGTIKLSIPESSIDTIIKIWDNIFPHRKIEFKDSKVTAKLGDNTYQGKEMSDGERVSLYLIGYCLSAHKEAIIIIDEPELHLHKSLMSNLWNQIETARPDCQFIYITHDLEFASSRTKAVKLWIKSFVSPDIWNWGIVPEIAEIPEELILQIIGSRKPVLFVEGEKGSYDYELFQYIFPKFTVLPRSNGAKVIESTKAMRSNASLHTIEAWGLTDRDYKPEAEVASLQQYNIKVCDVAEIENLLLTPEIIAVVARHQGYLDPTEFIDATTNFVISHLHREFEKEVSYTTSLEINYRLNAFNKKKIGLVAIKQTVDDLITTINVDTIYEQHRALYQDILDRRDLRAALRHYTNKGLLSNMSNIFRLGRSEYDKLIVRLLKTDKKAEIVAALHQYVPTIEPSNTVSPLASTPTIAG